MIDHDGDRGVADGVADVVQQTCRRTGDEVGRHQQDAVRALLLSHRHTGASLRSTATDAEPHRHPPSHDLTTTGEQCALLPVGEGTELPGAAAQEHGSGIVDDMALHVFGVPDEIQAEFSVEGGQWEGQQAGEGIGGAHGMTSVIVM